MLVYANLLIMMLVVCKGGLSTEAVPRADTGTAQNVKVSTSNNHYKLDIVSALSNWQTLSTLVSKTSKESPLFSDILKEATAKNPYLRVLLGSKRPSLADLLGIATTNTVDPFKSLVEATEHQLDATMHTQQYTSFSDFLKRLTGKTLVDFQNLHVAVSNVNHNAISAKEMMNVMQWALYNLSPLLKMVAGLKSSVISFDTFVSSLFNFDYTAYENAHIPSTDSKTTINYNTIKTFLNFIGTLNPDLKRAASFVHVENIAYTGAIDVADNLTKIFRILTGTPLKH